MRAQAMCSWLFTSALLLLLVGVAPAAADILISIDKSTQRMSVSIDGAQRYFWKVSTGRPGYDTPSGSFQPFRMEADYYSKEWDDAPMPHAMFFTRVGHAIHGSYDTRELGSPVSHGCVRISPENAALLYSLVQAEGLGHTKVIISGGAPAAVAGEVGATSRPRPAAARPSQYYAPSPRYYSYAAPAPWPYRTPYPDQNPYYDRSTDVGGW
jgi:hypothetical protein